MSNTKKSSQQALTILFFISLSAILVGIQLGFLAGLTAWVILFTLKSKVSSKYNPLSVKVVENVKDREDTSS